MSTSKHGMAAGIILLILSASSVTAQMTERKIYTLFLVEELEYQRGSDGDDLIGWQASSWIGGDWNRLWFKSEGEVDLSGVRREGEIQALYSRLVAPFWEFQVGVRGDLVADDQDSRQRAHFVVGLEGLAPYWFEIEPMIFVSHKGDISARLEASYDLFITQRLIAETSLETNLALQSVPEFGIGSGLNDIELALRTRYEIARELAPYLGVLWNQSFGETREIREAEAESASGISLIGGVRFWF